MTLERGEGRGRNMSVNSAWCTRPACISGFCGGKQLGVFLLHPGRDACPSQATLKSGGGGFKSLSDLYCHQSLAYLAIIYESSTCHFSLFQITILRCLTSRAVPCYQMIKLLHKSGFLQLNYTHTAGPVYGNPNSAPLLVLVQNFM